jgi:endonuclease YncB( thermonuclease family)
VNSALRLTRIADGKTFESKRVRVGEDSAISMWVAGLPAGATAKDMRIRLNGTDLPATWLGPDGQTNALLPSGLEPGEAFVSAVHAGLETEPSKIELYSCQSS